MKDPPNSQSVNELLADTPAQTWIHPPHLYDVLLPTISMSDS